MWKRLDEETGNYQKVKPTTRHEIVFEYLNKKDITVGDLAKKLHTYKENVENAIKKLEREKVTLYVVPALSQEGYFVFDKLTERKLHVTHECYITNPEDFNSYELKELRERYGFRQGRPKKLNY